MEPELVAKATQPKKLQAVVPKEKIYRIYFSYVSFEYLRRNVKRVFYCSVHISFYKQPYFCGPRKVAYKMIDFKALGKLLKGCLFFIYIATQILF